jgi:hypothetical protein
MHLFPLYLLRVASIIAEKKGSSNHVFAWLSFTYFLWDKPFLATRQIMRLCCVHHFFLCEQHSAPSMSLQQVLFESMSEACLEPTGAFEWMANTMRYPPN